MTTTYRKVFITIEGNIGGGKTTMINRLRSMYPEFNIIDEPVDVWTSMKDEEGRSLLELFYTDKQRWSYTFQNAAFITRYLSAYEALKKPITRDTIYISERGVLTDRYVFATMLKDDGLLTKIEWDLYTQWFDHFSGLVKVDGIVYIKTASDVCSSRIKTRGRQGEDGIPQDYLDALDKYHADWLVNTSVPVLTVTSEPEDVDKIATFASSFLC